MDYIKKLMEELKTTNPSANTEQILREMLKLCHGEFFPAKHIAKVASIKAKNQDWKRCPCDADNPERYCISELCKKTIREQGRCHCGCFTKVQEYNFEAQSASGDIL